MTLVNQPYIFHGWGNFESELVNSNVISVFTQCPVTTIPIKEFCSLINSHCWHFANQIYCKNTANSCTNCCTKTSLLDYSHLDEPQYKGMNAFECMAANLLAFIMSLLFLISRKWCGLSVQEATRCSVSTWPSYGLYTESLSSGWQALICDKVERRECDIRI